MTSHCGSIYLDYEYFVYSVQNDLSKSRFSANFLSDEQRVKIISQAVNLTVCRNIKMGVNAL